MQGGVERAVRDVARPHGRVADAVHGGVEAERVEATLGVQTVGYAQAEIDSLIENKAIKTQ